MRQFGFRAEMSRLVMKSLAVMHRVQRVFASVVVSATSASHLVDVSRIRGAVSNCFGQRFDERADLVAHAAVMRHRFVVGAG